MKFYFKTLSFNKQTRENMSSSELYRLRSVTPLKNLSKKEHNILSNACNKALESDFGSALRLGACLKDANHYILRSKLPQDTIR